MYYLMHIAAENLILFLQSLYKTLRSNNPCFLLLITDLYRQWKRDNYFVEVGCWFLPQSTPIFTRIKQWHVTLSKRPPDKTMSPKHCTYFRLKNSVKLQYNWRAHKYLSVQRLTQIYLWKVSGKVRQQWSMSYEIFSFNRHYS